MQRTLRARTLAVSVVAAVALGALGVFAGTAGADTASDDRATFVPQGQGPTVTTCAQIGLDNEGEMQVGADDASASDDNVSGVVKTNQNPDQQPGTGEELDVTILTPTVVIDAIVVKGGNGYNQYDTEAVLPPALQPDQHYISPLNNGGKVPAISHWFVCYHLGEEPLTGSLKISKTVTDPKSATAVVPTEFTVHVTCDSGEFDRTISVASPATITGLPDGDNCVVEETSELPAGAGDPVYTPATANTDGVDIVAGETPVEVEVHNDFSEVAGESVVAPVQPVAPAAAAVQASPAFTG
jgi:hypothetical protein